MKDVLGATCSGLCLVHCLGLPIIAATGTTFIGLAALSEESTHLWLSAAMLVIALWSFPSGWRIHKRLLPGMLAVVGVAFMAVALSVPETMEVYWVVVSAMAFIAGHLINRHLVLKRSI